VNETELELVSPVGEVRISITGPDDVGEIEAFPHVETCAVCAETMLLVNPAEVGKFFAMHSALHLMERNGELRRTGRVRLGPQGRFRHVYERVPDRGEG